MEEELMSYMDFSGINAWMDELFGRNVMSMEELMANLFEGNFKSMLSLLAEYVQTVCLGGLERCKNLFLGLLFLGIMAVLVSTFGDLVSDGRMEVFSRYFIFLFSSLFILRCFGEAYETAYGFLEEAETLAGVMMPSFCLAMGMANGPVTAAAFYELQLLLIFLIEKVLVGILLPLVQIHCMLQILNQLSESKHFAGLTELIKKAVMFVTKASLFVSIAGVLLQAAFLPAVDGVKSRIFIKTVSLFPGLGDYANVITEMLLQGATLLKGCIGVAGVFLFSFLCIRPIVMTLLYGAVIRVASAIMQISGEKKFTDHIWKTADSFFLLARVQLFGSGMFFVAIVIAASVFRK